MKCEKCNIEIDEEECRADDTCGCGCIFNACKCDDCELNKHYDEINAAEKARKDAISTVEINNMDIEIVFKNGEKTLIKNAEKCRVRNGHIEIELELARYSFPVESVKCIKSMPNGLVILQSI